MAAQRPNILVISTHDSGRHFGCYGVPTVQTPAIDALAGDGVKLTRMFAASSICSPSRGSLLTGQYPQRNGLIGLAGGCWNWELADPKRHLSHVLRDAGYRTGLFGVQHETTDLSTLGFDVRDPHPPAGPDGAVRDAVRIAEGFAEFCRREGAGDRPFYAQMGFHETHTPYDFGGIEPDEDLGVWTPPYVPADEHTDALRTHLAALQGSVRNVDRAVRIVTDALRETGLADDTLVLFNTDHGIELPIGASGVPWAKWSMYDPGIGIAFILRWPGGGLTGGRDCDWMLSNVDFLPTLAELIGAEFAHETDGVSFAAGLRGADTSGPGPRDELFALFVNAQLYAARTERHKLVRNFAEGNANPKAARGERQLAPTALLFDLERDPLERNDVAGDPAYAEVLDDMNGRLWRWLESVDAPILRGPVPTPYYRQAIADYHAWKQR